MVKANTYEEFSEILISPREPYDKKIVWIHPTEDNVEINLFKLNLKIQLKFHLIIC